MSLYTDRLEHAKQTGRWEEIKDDYGDVIAEVSTGRFRYPNRKETRLEEF